MANVDDLIRYLKADMVKTGDLIHFCDAGQIMDKDFKQNGSGQARKGKALEMEVMVGDTMKKILYTPNKVSIDLLKSAWGKDTQMWVGETGMVSIVEQIVFDKLQPVMVVKPVTNLNKAAQLQAKIEMANLQLQSGQQQVPKAAPEQDGSAAKPLNAWEEKDLLLKQKQSQIQD